MKRMNRNCTYWQKILPDYLAQELPAEQAAGLRSHLAVCPACRRGLARWRKTFALLALPAEDPGPGFAGEVLAALRREKAAAPGRFAPAGGPFFPAGKVFTGLVLTFFLALVLAGLLWAGGAFTLLPRETAEAGIQGGAGGRPGERGALQRGRGDQAGRSGAGQRGGHAGRY